MCSIPLTVAIISVFVAVLFAPLASARDVTAVYDFELDMSDAGLWTIDTVHLGTKQVMITYDADDKAAVMTPTWSTRDRESGDTGIRSPSTSSAMPHSRMWMGFRRACLLRVWTSRGASMMPVTGWR
jgi:hypothetical protein